MEWQLFWRLWIQKLLRNIASVKYQWMLLLYVPVIIGMFSTPQIITPTLGLGFLGGGFITLASTRILARTSLVEPKNEEEDLDTDK